MSVIELTPDRGGPGDEVLIRGTGFAVDPGATTVRFNGTAATVSDAAETSLTVTVPAGATTGPVTLTTPSGSATAPAAFVVEPAAVPTVAGVAPTVVAGGGTVTVTGTSFFPEIGMTEVALNGIVAVFGPGFSVLGQDTCVNTTAGDLIDTFVLPTTGSYFALVDPSGATTGAITVTLYDVGADLGGTLTPGTPVTGLRRSSPPRRGRRPPATPRRHGVAAPTPRRQADGTRKPISEVRVGDKVLATDPETGETGAA